MNTNNRNKYTEPTSSAQNDTKASTLALNNKWKASLMTNFMASEEQADSIINDINQSN